MNKTKVALALLLFFLGLLGVLSLLTVPLPLDSLSPEVLERFSERTLQWLSLINPSILLVGATIAGALLYDQVALGVPALEQLIRREPWLATLAEQARAGIVWGVMAGVLLVLVGVLFEKQIPTELAELSEKLQPTLAARFLYGGLTEEILMRFGLMTLVVWLGLKMVGRLTPAVYWSGILISALIFAMGHFPVVFMTVGSPPPGLIAYILLGNSIGGIIFGWLYWKKGLEAAFVAHICAHVVMIAGENFLAV